MECLCSVHVLSRPLTPPPPHQLLVSLMPQSLLFWTNLLTPNHHYDNSVACWGEQHISPGVWARKKKNKILNFFLRFYIFAKNLLVSGTILTLGHRVERVFWVISWQTCLQPTTHDMVQSSQLAWLFASTCPWSCHSLFTGQVTRSSLDINSCSTQLSKIFAPLAPPACMLVHIHPLLHLFPCITASSWLSEVITVDQKNNIPFIRWKVNN